MTVIKGDLRKYVFKSAYMLELAHSLPATELQNSPLHIMYAALTDDFLELLKNAAQKGDLSTPLVDAWFESFSLNIQQGSTSPNLEDQNQGAIPSNIPSLSAVEYFKIAKILKSAKCVNQED